MRLCLAAFVIGKGAYPSAEQLSRVGLPQAEFDQACGLLDLTALELPPPGRAAELLQGTPEETARQLAGLLKEKGGVL